MTIQFSIGKNSGDWAVQGPVYQIGCHVTLRQLPSQIPLTLTLRVVLVLRFPNMPSPEWALCATCSTAALSAPPKDTQKRQRKSKAPKRKRVPACNDCILHQLRSLTRSSLSACSAHSTSGPCMTCEACGDYEDRNLAASNMARARLGKELARQGIRDGDRAKCGEASELLSGVFDGCDPFEASELYQDLVLSSVLAGRLEFVACLVECLEKEGWVPVKEMGMRWPGLDFEDDNWDPPFAVEQAKRKERKDKHRRLAFIPLDKCKDIFRILAMIILKAHVHLDLDSELARNLQDPAASPNHIAHLQRTKRDQEVHILRYLLLLKKDPYVIFIMSQTETGGWFPYTELKWRMQDPVPETTLIFRVGTVLKEYFKSKKIIQRLPLVQELAKKALRQIARERGIPEEECMDVERTVVKMEDDEDEVREEYDDDPDYRWTDVDSDEE